MTTLRQSTEQRRRSLRPVLLALLVAAVAATVAPSASAAGCAKGSVRVTVNGKPSCVRPAALLGAPGSPAAMQQRAIAFAESAAVRRKLGGSAAYVPRVDRRLTAARKRAAALTVAAARTAPSGPQRRPAAAAPRRPAQVETIVKPLSGMPGWKGQVTNRSWDLSDEVQAFGGRGETVAEQTANGVTARLVKAVAMGGTLQSCPDATGTVRGTWNFTTSDRIAAVQEGGTRAEHGLRIETTAEVTVHVADDASIESYDLEIIYVLQVTAESVEGGKLRHEPTRTYRGRVVLVGLEAGGRPDLRAVVASPALRVFAMWGPKGRVSAAEMEVLKSLGNGVSSIFHLLPESMNAVQRHWDHYAECFTVEFPPGEGAGGQLELQEGETRPIAVRVLHRSGQETPLDLKRLWTSETLAASVNALHAPGSFDLTAKAPDTFAAVGVEAVTRRGRVAGTLGVAVKKRPSTTLRYRVLEASFREQTVAERTEGLNTCRLVGLPIGGRGIFSGTSAGASDAEGALRPGADGSLGGSLTTRIPAHLTDQQLHGCQRGPTGTQVPCATTLADDAPRPDGRAGMGIRVEAPAGSDSARMTLTVRFPLIGYLEPDDSVCRVYEITQPFPTEWHTADVPRSQLEGTAPFTVYLTGSHVWTTDLDGNPAHVEFVWEYHVVLQRLP